jgi:hypothetical protein
MGIANRVKQCHRPAALAGRSRLIVLSNNPGQPKKKRDGDPVLIADFRQIRKSGG